MTVRQKPYKFRIYPTKEQTVMFSKTFGCSRAIWNMMLADKIKHYEETGQTLKNTPAQYKKEFEWLKEVDSLALANVQLNLQKAINLSSNLDLVFQNSRKNVIVNLTKQTTKTGQLLYLMEKSSSLKLGG